MNSTASSKKSVRLALGEEQTAVRPQNAQILRKCKLTFKVNLVQVILQRTFLPCKTLKWPKYVTKSFHCIDYSRHHS